MELSEEVVQFIIIGGIILGVILLFFVVVVLGNISQAAASAADHLGAIRQQIVLIRREEARFQARIADALEEANALKRQRS